ncbi:RadC family protein [Phosphitispora sp. TUW77]|uniref:RadC family protein n=1 Tax=Phosphitispora sp. TUW77 TaxID=3152361 RepID=UPI003AB2F377
MESTKNGVRIKELPEDLRPRERLAREGAEALSTVELLAVLLRTGSDSMSALDLATLVIAKTGGLLGLAECASEELYSIKGIGPAKVAQIKASIELGRRLAFEISDPKKVIKTPYDVFNLLKERMRYLDREHFIAVSLNTKHHVITIETVSVGNLNSSLVHPRELFKNSIKRSAAALVLAHNHPSGDPSPSAEDVQITRRLVEAGKLIGIEVIDHIIIGECGFTSLKELGVI